MYIECFNCGINYFTDIVVDLYQNNTVKTYMPFNHKIAYCGDKAKEHEML
jgi:hypothetical protein